MSVQFLILIFGFALLIYGADTLVNGATGIAKKFRIPEILIGLTIVTLGTSLPELIVIIISATSGNTDIIFGNVVGSNICNLLLILGVVTIIKPLKFEKTTIKQHFPLLILITTFVLIIGLGLFSNNKLALNTTHGIILLIIALVYFIYPILEYLEQRKEFKKLDSNSANIENKSILLCVIYIILGGLTLKYGGDFVVNSSTKIATILNIPERVISLTIVALGTSLPELVTSIVAIIKHNDDLAEGNIIGSCTINLCLILGLGATITNITLEISYIKDLILLLGYCILIWLYALCNKNNTLTRLNGSMLLLLYFVYTIKLFI